ncbi:MAG TPA: GNAT family N-acetyltransferase [Gemmatimonadales bacterium]|nr:GNAT family N-acetyltransferase [Gemmatimonadales bacterium]
MSKKAGADLSAFSTPRLDAERLTQGHLPELRRMHRDAAVMAQLGGVRDDAQTDAYLAKNLKHWDDYGFGLWILRALGGGEPVGRAVLRHLLVEDVDEIEVGYAFYEPFWGRGLATEVATACVELGRRTLGLTTIVAVTSPENRASQHVLEKCGLVYEREFMHEGARASLFRTRAATLR